MLRQEGDQLPGDVADGEVVADGHDGAGTSERSVTVLQPDQSAEERGEIRLDQDVAEAGRTAVRQEHRSGRRPAFDRGLVTDDVGREPLGDREPLGQLDGGRQHVGET